MTTIGMNHSTKARPAREPSSVNEDAAPRATHDVAAQATASMSRALAAPTSVDATRLGAMVGEGHRKAQLSRPPTPASETGTGRPTRGVERGPSPAAVEAAVRGWDQANAVAAKIDRKDTLANLDVLVPGLNSGAQNLVLHANQRGPSPYEADTQRTVAQMLERRDGGSCGSHGRVLADALVRSGTDAARVHLVDTVGKGQAGGSFASGHQFLLVQGKDDAWNLVNSTSAARESVPYPSPQQLQARMADPAAYARNPQRVRPSQDTFPELTRPGGETAEQRTFARRLQSELTAFAVHRSDAYPPHSRAERAAAMDALLVAPLR